MFPEVSENGAVAMDGSRYMQGRSVLVEDAARGGVTDGDDGRTAPSCCFHQFCKETVAFMGVVTNAIACGASGFCCSSEYGLDIVGRVWDVGDRMDRNAVAKQR